MEIIEKWKVQDSVENYGIQSWGKGYFGINSAGHVTVHPTKDPEKSIDLKELIDQLQTRGIQLPILLRFTDILRHRIGEIYEAFRLAIQEYDYKGSYCCVYPIKMNILARKIGKEIIPVVEKFSELEAIVRYSQELNVRPLIGVRVKLASRGSGRWKYSAGFRSKFGLTLAEVLEAYDYLKERELADCLQLVHFHLGSQITNIRNIKGALTEAARIYVELTRIGANPRYLDVGGGLGVDYDGSQTDFESSVNYTLQEYANDVVFRIKSVCDDAGVAHPTIISESGRAVVAYHSLLVFDVLGVSNFDRYQATPTVSEELLKDAP